MTDARAPQELVVTMLGSYLRPRAERSVWAGGLVTLLGELGFSEGAARIALARLVHRELLHRRKDGRRVHYTLTDRATSLLEDGDRRIFALGRQRTEPGEWTLLWHNVPEDRRPERERLVRRLRFLGFGTLGDGIWLTPHDREADVVALLGELGIERHAALLRGGLAAALDPATLIRRAWDLEELGRRYTEFVQRFRGLGTGRDGLPLDDPAAFGVRTTLTHAFRQFPMFDPELPGALVAPPTSRAEAVRLFDDLYAALAEPAQRHFDEVTKP
ncbi:transcriptional regulator, PaaX family [Amycolatopsis marina]|uniref:Transcriptional regulator, PaaX family n=1 Tax=Amycolatopsis marina TaxID=490629 RepID=A0A1I0YP11_9PSEU|nr:PaaX family transcriptional regulator C-terminal domain-containing protein [Amycolatopsis marina]SFB14962.1 transcriptional regulator, PaaX family [Amycolatopsis marina]